MASTRVVLADDHPMVRATIHNLLEKAAGIKIVGEATNGREALQLVEELQPDVLLLDMEMPDFKGFEIMQQLQARGAPVRILALSAYNDKQYILKVLDYGAAGYLTKDTSPQTIIETVRRVAQDETSHRNSQPISHIGGQPQPELIDQEIEILRLVGKGKTIREIGISLGISEEGILNHLRASFAKLNVTNSIEAVAKAVQAGII